jgi:hypothetical protein
VIFESEKNSFRTGIIATLFESFDAKFLRLVLLQLLLFRPGKNADVRRAENRAAINPLLCHGNLFVSLIAFRQSEIVSNG